MSNNDYERGVDLIQSLFNAALPNLTPYDKDCIKQILDFISEPNNDFTRLRRFSLWRPAWKQPTCVASYTTLENAIEGAQKYAVLNDVGVWVSERYLNDLFVAVWESSPDVGMLGAKKKGNGKWPKSNGTGKGR